MAQYIEKSALVVEIEKRKKEAESNCGGYKSYDEHRCDSCIVGFYEEFLEILDTLEVIEIGVDLGDPKGDKSSEYTVDTKTFEVKDDVVSNDTTSNPLEISRHGNYHIGETLEEAAENYPSIIRTISPQWETEVESAFIAGAKWQKEQTIEKICKWLEDNVDHYAYNKDFVPNAKERFIKMFRRAEI